MKILCASFLIIIFVSLPSSTSAAVGMQRIAANLADPVDIVHAGDGSGRLFIVQQGGKIKIWNGTRVFATPFLDITSLVLSGGEQGLLSVAFHPRYRSNGFFYVYYTNLNGDIVIARYQVSRTNPNIANRRSRLILLTIPHPINTNHNGGKMIFGRNGYLYISVGDGGGGGDRPNNAQNLGKLLGKMLRIDVNSGLRYGIPPTNPFVGVAGARKEIWALGLRNPWRWSMDRINGNFYIGDVGQENFEEVSFQGARSSGGENYGWRRMEGKHCFNPSSGCATGSLKLPILEYTHAEGCSITGGYVYRGNKIPALYGMYVFADYCAGVIMGAKKVNGVWRTSRLLATGKRISTFGEDSAGELYFAARANPDGAVYRIIRR